MITLNSPSSLPPIPQDVMMNLLALLQDPEGVRKHVAEIVAARMDWAEAKSSAEQALSELDTKRAGHQATIAKERAEHDAKLKSARQASNSECQRAMDEVRRAKAETEKLNAKARADSEAAATIRADLERRLALLKQAAM